MALMKQLLRVNSVLDNLAILARLCFAFVIFEAYFLSWSEMFFLDKFCGLVFQLSLEMWKFECILIMEVYLHILSHLITFYLEKMNNSCRIACKIERRSCTIRNFNSFGTSTCILCTSSCQRFCLHSEAEYLDVRC